MVLNKLSKNISTYIKNNYGSKKGLLYTTYYNILGFLGIYNKYTHISMAHIDRIVFICKGNICRSAYAEVVARTLGLNAISCGINAIESAPANENAINIAEIKGHDLTSHKTTPILNVKFNSTDLLVVMEPSQISAVNKIIIGSPTITLLGLWAKNKMPYIHDPYNSSLTYFNRCFDQIEKFVNEISQKK